MSFGSYVRKKQMGKRYVVDRKACGENDKKVLDNDKPKKVEAKNKKDLPIFDSLTKEVGAATVHFTDRAAAKLFSLLLFCDTLEVGWHGSVERIKDGEYLVDDIYLYSQEIGTVTINAADAGYGKWQSDTLINDPDKIERLRLHGHSHVNMGVSPSGTDLDYQEDIIEGIQENDFFIFMIINRRMDCFFKIVDRKFNKLYSTAKIDTSTGALKELGEQYKEYVKEKTYTTPTTSLYSGVYDYSKWGKGGYYGY